MKNLLFTSIIIIIISTILPLFSFGQTLPNVTVRALESSGDGCFNETNPVEGVICYDILLKVDQPNWLLYSYNIWLSYGNDNSILSFTSEDPCYHQKGGAVDLDQFGKYRVLAANVGLPFEANKERIIHNICLDVMDFTGLDRLKLIVGGDHYGLVSSVNLVDQSNSQNAVNPMVSRKTKRLKPKNLSCLQIEPNASHVCVAEGIELISLAKDATGSTIPDDCEPFTYEWLGPNGFTSTDANPLVDFTSPHFRSGDFAVTVTGANGCEGSSTFSFNSYYCTYSPQRSTSPSSTQSVEEQQVNHTGVSVLSEKERINLTASASESPVLLNVYPNPVLSELIIQCDKAMYKKGTLTNGLGLLTRTFDVHQNETRINMDNYPLGLYFMTLEGDHSTHTTSFIKM